jgi:hypothetical protein
MLYAPSGSNRNGRRRRRRRRIRRRRSGVYCRLGITRFCPSSGVLKDTVLETSFVSILRGQGEIPTVSAS